MLLIGINNVAVNLLVTNKSVLSSTECLSRRNVDRSKFQTLYEMMPMLIRYILLIIVSIIILLLIFKVLKDLKVLFLSLMKKDKCGD